MRISDWSSDVYSSDLGAIMAITTTNLRTVMGSMDLDETLSKRDEINARLLGVVDHATSPWGLKITRVEIKDIRPPHDISDAMARQMTDERLKRAEILEAEGQRARRLPRAEGAKQSAILSAAGTDRKPDVEGMSGSVSHSVGSRTYTQT